MAETIVLKVGMSCEVCSGKVQKVLEEMEGVESFDINLKEQKVTVKGSIQPEAVFEAVSKVRRNTSFWEAEPAAAPEEASMEVKATEAQAEAETKASEKDVSTA